MNCYVDYVTNLTKSWYNILASQLKYQYCVVLLIFKFGIVLYTASLVIFSFLFYNFGTFLSILVFFRNIYDSLSGTLFLSPLHHLHPLHKHLDTQTLRLGRAITAESSPQLAAGLEPRTFGFQAQVLKLILKIFLSNKFLEQFIV